MVAVIYCHVSSTTELFFSGYSSSGLFVPKLIGLHQTQPLRFGMNLAGSVLPGGL